jgi:hypothetical protein
MGLVPGRGGQGGPPIVSDIVRGALLGDWAGELGLPGAITQVALNFVPVDRVGMALNLLAIVPWIGAVAKATEVWRHVQRLRRGYEVTYRVRRPQPY